MPLPTEPAGAPQTHTHTHTHTYIYMHTYILTLTLCIHHSTVLWDGRWDRDVKKRTLVPSEAPKWCEWINHLQLSIQNTYAWANGRTPPPWGEKLMCWWAMSQIFTGQIQDCRQFHYLPVSHPVIWSVFLSISVSLCLSLPLLLARSMKSWLRVWEMKRKQNAFWSSRLVLQLRQRALPW